MVAASNAVIQGLMELIVTAKELSQKSPEVISAQYAITSSTENRQNELVRRLSLIRTFSVALAVLILLETFFSLGRILSGDLNSIILQILAILVALVSISCFIMARPNASSTKAQLASFLLIGSVFFVLIAVQFLPDKIIAFRAAFILIPIFAALLGLRFRAIIILTVLSALALVVTNIVDYVGNVSNNNLSDAALVTSNWLTIYIIAAIGIVTFSRRMDAATTLAEQQTERLRNLLKTLNATTDSGSTLSRELSGVTTELDVASHQQATGTQEQVAAITQVTSSLEELNESASRIALNAKAVVASANEAVDTATELKYAGQLSQSSAIKGYEAVEQAVKSVQKMRDNIEQMASRLLRLTEHTNNVSKIIDLINDVAEETHLLALNASIEAASNLSGGTARSGERFGVIAMEIKNLADRSKDSTKEIRETITEMQNAVAAAVLTAEEGRKETFAAVERTQLSGIVIQTLTEIIADSYRRADQILEVAQTVKTRCDEISLATNQQRSANQQILATMREIGRISQENAGSVTQLAGMAVRVNRQVEELNDVLTTSNEVLLTLVA